MKLSTKLALSFGVTAVVVAGAITLVNFRVTSTSLEAEIDRTLATYAKDARLTDGDGQESSRFCQSVKQAESRSLTATVGGLPFTTARCLDRSGAVVSTLIDDDLQVDGEDLSIASGTQDIQRFHNLRFGREEYRVLTVPTPFGAIQLARNLDEERRVLRSLAIRSTIAAGVAAIAAACAGWFIARRSTRQVVALTGAAEQIASTGRLDIAVPRAGSDETGRLTRSFTTMLDALGRSREQQQRLAQDAGHELRTPLTSLRTNVDTLRRYPQLDDERKQRVLMALDTELRELTTLTNELVSLASASNDDELPETLDLAELAQRSARRAERRTGRIIAVDSTPTPIVGQSRQLLRVIDNLLENAAKFSSAPHPIEVVVRNNQAVVRDHGPGIPAEDLPKIFERFYRSTTSRTMPGSGLGLSIVHDIVTHHGGTVTAANHPDGGAVFTITLPAALADNAIDPTPFG